MKIIIALDKEIACNVGAEEALFYCWLIQHCQHLNAVDNVVSIVEGRISLITSFEQLHNIFPFWSVNQLHRILTKLQEGSFITFDNDRKEKRLVVSPLDEEFKKIQKSRKKVTKVDVEVDTDNPDMTFVKANETGDLEELTKTRKEVVNMMIHCFKEVNPSSATFYAIPVQRKALENMIVNGYDVTIMFKLLSLVPYANATPYAPIITSPVEFERLAPKLFAFAQRKYKEGDKRFKIQT